MASTRTKDSTTKRRPQARRRVRSAPTVCPTVPVPKSFHAAVERIARRAADELVAGFEGQLPTTAAEFMATEKRMLDLVGAEIVSAVLALILQLLHEHRQFVLWCLGAARSRTPLRTNADRLVAVRVAGGEKVKILTPYMTPPPVKRPGPKRKRGGRGAGGAGLYPVLAALGFLCRVSPYVASLTARLACQLDSYEEAAASLARQQLKLDVNQVRGIAHRFADGGLVAREAGIGGNPKRLAGKRVVICADGGRLRYRIDKRGRPRKSGYHGYHAPWREPKVLALYTVNAQGQRTGEAPIYEGTLAPWDDAFEFFVSILSSNGAKDAEVLLFAADGSNTIWDRKDELIERLGIDPSRVRECVDFYHATEHLDAAVRLSGGFTEKRRQQWVRKQAKRLKRDGITRVVAALEALPFPSDREKADELHKEIKYFRSRIDRMKYGKLKAQGLPIGTGAVESAVRRVVNMRLKSTGTFWKPENAERILFLRCRLKAQHWFEAEQAAFESALLPGCSVKPKVLTRVCA